MRALPMALMALIAMVAVAACTPSGDTSSSPSTTDVLGVREVTAPPVRLTPFCQAMLDLDAELPDDPAVDTTAQVLAAYQAALPVVPDQIAEEFRAVIAALESGTSATLPDAEDAAETVPAPATPAVPPSSVAGPTTLPSEEERYAEEGRLPDDDPAARVNAYIDFACRGTANNPGPPATAPDAAPPTSTEP